jgi:hypothetical protein
MKMHIIVLSFITCFALMGAASATAKTISNQDELIVIASGGGGGGGAGVGAGPVEVELEQAAEPGQVRVQALAWVREPVVGAALVLVLVRVLVLALVLVPGRVQVLGRMLVLGRVLAKGSMEAMVRVTEQAIRA